MAGLRALYCNKPKVTIPLWGNQFYLTSRVGLDQCFSDADDKGSFEDTVTKGLH